MEDGKLALREKLSECSCAFRAPAPLPGLRLGQLGPAASPDPGVPLRAGQSSWATPAGVGGPLRKARAWRAAADSSFLTRRRR